MNASDLHEHELLVLIGLVKLIVHADQVVSEEERAMLRLLQTQVGEKAWNESVREAATAFQDIAALEEACQRVERTEAQLLIHQLLSHLAGSDEVIPEEAHVLQWIDQTWALSEEEDDEDDVETFVLMEE